MKINERRKLQERGGNRVEEKVENNGGRRREVQNRPGISREGYE